MPDIESREVEGLEEDMTNPDAHRIVRPVGRPRKEPDAAPRDAAPRTSSAGIGVATGGSVFADQDRAAPIRESTSEAPERITRVSRSQRTEGMLQVPQHMKKPGWDYQYWETTILNQPVDGSRMAEIHAGGWRPVPSREMPLLLPPGYTGEYIESYGQRLYMRPLRLSQEARDEDYQAAEQQKRDRVQGALEGRVSGGEGVRDIKGVIPVNLGLQVEGEVGTQEHRPR